MADTWEDHPEMVAQSLAHLREIRELMIIQAHQRVRLALQLKDGQVRDGHRL